MSASQTTVFEDPGIGHPKLLETKISGNAIIRRIAEVRRKHKRIPGIPFRRLNMPMLLLSTQWHKHYTGDDFLVEDEIAPQYTLKRSARVRFPLLLVVIFPGGHTPAGSFGNALLLVSQDPVLEPSLLRLSTLLCPVVCVVFSLIDRPLHS